MSVQRCVILVYESACVDEMRTGVLHTRSGCSAADRIPKLGSAMLKLASLRRVAKLAA